MPNIIDILSSESPALPDFARLGNRIFVTDGFHNNKVIMNSAGDWRPMGAREQVAALDIATDEDADGPLEYGGRVTYGLRRVVKRLPVSKRGLQERGRAHDVRADELARSVYGTVDMRFCGQVEDRVGAKHRKCLGHRGLVAYVGLEERKARRDACE